MKKALYISATIVLLLGVGMFVYFRFLGTDGTNVNSNTNSSTNTNSVACTMEAKLCPDGTAVGRIPPNCEFADCPEVDSLLTEAEARDIAEASCIKGGESLVAGTYNENTKTWWYDANLNATREGCSPACVVSEQTQTAEINWRCTGLVEP
ncbi:MAG: hypothetical protein WC495_02010 [Patescibacteria group bacterium]|jgi:hypothetical protein